MPFSQTLLPEFDEEIKNTRKMLECVPDGKFDYQPHTKSMTLGQLATHVALLPAWTITALDTEFLDLPADFKPELAASRAELLLKFDKGAADARGSASPQPATRTGGRSGPSSSPATPSSRHPARSSCEAPSSTT